jgi:hypothetical protein
MMKFFVFAVTIVAMSTTAIGAVPGLKLFVSGVGNDAANGNLTANGQPQSVPASVSNDELLDKAIAGNAAQADSRGYIHSDGTIENDIASRPPSEAMTMVPPPDPLPEPGTLALLGMGLVGIGAYARRKINI